MITRSMSMPPANDTASVRTSASQNGRPAAMNCQAMYVENIASSPWAKLTIPVNW